MTDPIEPLFTHDEPFSQFTIKDLSGVLTSSGLAYPTANARIANYAKNRLIHVRVKGRNTQPNIFAISDVASSVILSTLQDSGIADHEVLQAASLPLYAWRNVAPPSGSGSPVLIALDGVRGGEPWTFRLDFWRDTQNGQKLIDGYLSGPNGRLGFVEIAPQMVPISTVVIVLDQHFLPVLRKLNPDKTGN